MPSPQHPDTGQRSQKYWRWFTDWPETHRLAGQTVEVQPAEVAEQLYEALRVAHKHIANDHLVLAVRTLDAALTEYEGLAK